MPSARTSPDSAFSMSFVSLALSLTGAGTCFLWLVHFDASPIGYALTGLAEAVLVIICLLHLRTYRTGPIGGNRPADARMRTLSYANAGWAGALALLGASLGALIVRSEFVPLAVILAVLFLVPWHKVALCTSSPLFSSALLCGATIAVAAWRSRDIDYMFLPLSGWLFLASSCTILLARMIRTRHARKRSAFGRDITSII